MQRRSRTNQKNYNDIKASLCTACLSTDRKLVVLKKFDDYQNLWKIIIRGDGKPMFSSGRLPAKLVMMIMNGRNITANITVNAPQVTPGDVFLCWECLALLRNIKKFRDKVRAAQNFLKSSSKDKKNRHLKSFSNLSISPRDYTAALPESIDAKLFETKTLEENKIEIEIKQEHESDFDNSEYNFETDKCTIEKIAIDEINGTNNFVATPEPECPKSEPESPKSEPESPKSEPGSPKHEHLKKELLLKTAEDLKTESEINESESSQKKNNKHERSKRFQIGKHRKDLYKINKIHIDMGDIFTKIQIQPSEVCYWFEKERESDYFKALKYKCVKCASKIRKKEISVHGVKMHSARKYTCEACQYTFTNKRALVKHLSYHSYIRACKKCEYRCVRKLNMYRHVRREHSQVVECLRCDYSFRNTRDFYGHYKTVHYESDSYFACDHCNKKCRQKTVLARHIKNYHMPHYCKECNMTFRNFRTMYSHLKLRHHVQRSEETYCVQCDIQFDNRILFRNHINTNMAHSNEWKRPKRQGATCPTCGKVYTKMMSMKNHYNQVHAKILRFVCGECNKSFLTNYRLKVHKRFVHEGFEKPKDKICSYCGRAFAESAVLRKHIRTHTGERPFKCPHCDAAFAQRTPMLTHIKNIHKKKELHLASTVFT